LSDNRLLPWWRTLPAFGQTTHKGLEGRCSEVNNLIDECKTFPVKKKERREYHRA
jgi:hypothetical protein